MSRHDPPKLEAANLEATNVIGMTSLLNPPPHAREKIDQERDRNFLHRFLKPGSWTKQYVS
jgi:hypothetical protein